MRKIGLFLLVVVIVGGAVGMAGCNRDEDGFFEGTWDTTRQATGGSPDQYTTTIEQDGTEIKMYVSFCNGVLSGTCDQVTNTFDVSNSWCRIIASAESDDVVKGTLYTKIAIFSDIWSITMRRQ